MKHVITKHGHLVQDELNSFATFNNFVLDPQHLAATAQTPAAIDDKLPLPTLPTLSMVGAAGSGVGMPLLNPSFAAGGLGQGSGGPAQQQQQQQMMMMMMQMQQAMMMQMQNGAAAGGGGGSVGGVGMGTGAGVGGMSAGTTRGGASRNLVDRMGGYANGSNTGTASLPLPPAPPGGEDPRARRGRVSYQDLDEAGGGAGAGGGLPY